MRLFPSIINLTKLEIATSKSFSIFLFYFLNLLIRIMIFFVVVYFEKKRKENNQPLEINFSFFSFVMNGWRCCLIAISKQFSKTRVGFFIASHRNVYFVEENIRKFKKFLSLIFLFVYFFLHKKLPQRTV